MALTIENATIGYNANEVEQALTNLNTKCIVETISSMRKGYEDLVSAVNEAWVGKSAETFKNNMLTDINTIEGALNSTYDVLKSEMYQIVNTMQENEENVLQERGA